MQNVAQGLHRALKASPSQSTMSQARLLLTALGYSSPEEVDLSEQQSIRQIVSWLESRKVPLCLLPRVAGSRPQQRRSELLSRVCLSKIRQYKPEQRKGIGDLTAPDWDRHFSKVIEQAITIESSLENAAASDPCDAVLARFGVSTSV